MKTATLEQVETQLLPIAKYPAAIEAAEIAYNQQCSLERVQKLEVDDFDGDFEIQIAGNKACNNEQERKAKRATLRKGQAYRKSLGALHKILDDKATAYARLNRLRNEFRIVLSQHNLTIPGVNEN